MQTIRRLYLYVLSGITLGMLLVGLTLLLEVTLAALGIGRGALADAGAGDRERLSVAAALVGVGLPVWGIHWFFVERGLQSRNPHADAERGSTVRALYFSVVLGVLLAFGASAGLSLLLELFRITLGAPAPEFTAADPANALAVLVVTGAAWTYHAGIRRRDMRAGPLTEAAAWLPRLYLYGASLIGLGILLLTLGNLLTFAIDAALGAPPGVVEPGFRAGQLAAHLAAIVVWGAVWLGHWWYAGRLAADSGWRGTSERPANLRLAFFLAMIGISAFAVIWYVSRAASAVLVPVLGASGAFGEKLDGTDLVQAALGALVAAMPWAIAWWLHVRWVRTESVQADNGDRAATVDRLDFSIVGLVALGFGAVGFAWILGLLIDLVLGGNRASGEGWRVEMVQTLPWAALGFVIWAWNWVRLQTRHAADPAVEAESRIRRSYLLLILAVTVLASLGSLAVVLYRIFSGLLDVASSQIVSDLSGPLGSLLVAGAIAIYHGIALRRDMALRAAAEPTQPPAQAEPEIRRGVVLTGPAGSDLDAALQTLRAQLPAGFRLDES
jgi:hypothetical protein